jgi:hypothetical protein
VERRAWAGVATNLATDTLYLSRRARQLDVMIAAYDALIAGRAPADSVESYMDLAISYVNFVRTDFAYEELRQSSSARQVRNAALLERTSRMYTSEYSLADEWEAINRDFATNRFFKDAQRTVYRLALARARQLHAEALAESR